MYPQETQMPPDTSLSFWKYIPCPSRNIFHSPDIGKKIPRRSLVNTSHAAPFLEVQEGAFSHFFPAK
jgi:hypothetical protein